MAIPRTINGELTSAGKQAVLYANVVKCALVSRRIGTPAPKPRESPEEAQRRRQVSEALTRHKEQQEATSKAQKRNRALVRNIRLTAKEDALATRQRIIESVRASLASEEDKARFLALKEEAYAPGAIRRPARPSESDRATWEDIEAANRVASTLAGL